MKPDHIPAQHLRSVKPVSARRVGLWIGFALFLAVVALWLLLRLAEVIAVIVLAVAVAAALARPVTWLERWLPRPLAVVIVYIVAILPPIIVAWFVIPQLITQVELAAEQMPVMFDSAEDWLRQQALPISVVELRNGVVSQIDNLSATLVVLPVTLVSAGLEILLGLFISIYTLIALPGIRSFFFSLLAAERHAEVQELLDEVFNTMGGFIRGSALTALIIGVLMYVGLSLLDVNYPLTLAAIAGALEVFPVVGPLIAAIPILMVALLQSPTKFLITALFVLVIQQLEGNWIVPQIMKTQAKIPPLLVIIALFVGGTLGGILGAFVAIPIAAALRVLVVRQVAPSIRRRTLYPLSELDEVGEPETAEADV